jgi:predicted RNase H-like HicB family nuclease
MDTLKVIVSGGKDHYGAWAKDVEGIYGVGNTLDEIKDNVKDAIALYLEYNNDAPEILKGNPEIELMFDITGLVKYYSQFITLPAMENLTGVNQKQLWQYANGYKIPRKETTERIEKGLKRFARRLEHEAIAV